MRRGLEAQVTTEAESTPSRAEVEDLLKREQVRLSVEQVRRIPIPHFLVDVCVTWIGWHAGLRNFSLTWLAIMTIAQVARTRYVLYVDGRKDRTASQMLFLLANLLTVLGGIQAAIMIAVFTQPMNSAQYIFTMLMVGNAAGAVSPAAGHLKSYLLWASVFGGTLAVCWVSLGTVEGIAIAVLIVLLFGILSLYVRDQGRSLVTLVTLSHSLRRERDRAERASEAKTRFFAAASHDLRQPLTALSYNAATVQALAASSGDETLTKVGEGIGRALAESRGLLDSLLEVSELDAGSVVVSSSTVDIGAMLQEIRDSALPSAEDRGLNLLLELEPGTRLLAETDATLVRRIIQNLVGNAIKFTLAGNVTIEGRRENLSSRSIFVGIHDTGPGIATASQERVFDEFYQIGNTERNRSRGLGLGLAIVRRLATLLKIEVILDSALSRGSSFSFTLPDGRDWSLAAHSNVPRGVMLSRPERVGRRLLLVDDEPHIRESLKTFLTTTGWTVEVAASEGDALAFVEAGFRPEAVIVDFRLQDGASGLDALASLRGMGVSCPAWLITGDTEPTRIAAARAAGVPVLYKPVDGMELLGMLEKTLDAAAGDGSVATKFGNAHEGTSKIDRT
jgi:signal transduction histidine kinase/ActR/RegA family two-component response regulator